MSKIQVTAVELKAQSEVIVLNASFVARVVRAAENLKPIKSTLEDAFKKYELDEEGKRIKDANGNYVTKFDFDRQCVLHSTEGENLYKKVIPFIEDLCTALVGQEDER